MLTIKNIYESVTAHLLSQGAVSEDENGSCRLRSPNGRKCAIGSLLRDECYQPDFEGIGISYYRGTTDGALLRALYASQIDVYRPEVMDLLIELEEVHDDAPVEDWADLLAAIGRRHAFV